MKIKITCYTPKGKALKSSKTFASKYFDLFHKPVKTKIVSSSEFYYIYEYDNMKQINKIINKKIPKAEQSIRNFYWIIIHVVSRANKLTKKGALKLEKARRWIMKQLKKKVKNPKEMEDFIDSINMEDKDEMMEFLTGTLFEYEIL